MEQTLGEHWASLRLRLLEILDAGPVIERAAFFISKPDVIGSEGEAGALGSPSTRTPSCQRLEGLWCWDRDAAKKIQAFLGGQSCCFYVKPTNTKISRESNILSTIVTVGFGLPSKSRHDFDGLE